MVSGLVDYMSTLVSGGEPTMNANEPPPLPPKAHRVTSADPRTKPVLLLYHFSLPCGFSLSQRRMRFVDMFGGRCCIYKR